VRRGDGGAFRCGKGKTLIRRAERGGSESGRDLAGVVESGQGGDRTDFFELGGHLSCWCAGDGHGSGRMFGWSLRYDAYSQAPTIAGLAIELEESTRRSRSKGPHFPLSHTSPHPAAVAAYDQEGERPFNSHHSFSGKKEKPHHVSNAAVRVPTRERVSRFGIQDRRHPPPPVRDTRTGQRIMAGGSRIAVHQSINDYAISEYPGIPSRLPRSGCRKNGPTVASVRPFDARGCWYKIVCNVSASSARGFPRLRTIGPNWTCRCHVRMAWPPPQALLVTERETEPRGFRSADVGVNR